MPQAQSSGEPLASDTLRRKIQEELNLEAHVAIDIPLKEKLINVSAAGVLTDTDLLKLYVKLSDYSFTNFHTNTF